MISHPFEIDPSTNNAGPSVLMVTWRGTPAQSMAEIYLPAVAASAILGLADTIYGRHRLTATDANTIQFPATDLTLIPVPAGTGRLAGLLSVEPHPSLPQGRRFTVSVRQLQPKSATTRTPPPPPPSPRVGIAGSKAEISNKQTFAWRQVQGAFQYTITGKPEDELLPGQERLVAWLKWRCTTLPATSRWKPVLERYLKYTSSLVWNLGKDPNSISPSPFGKTDSGSDRPIPIHHERECTGKVVVIDYDRFGDFCGFVVLTESGHERVFRATEHAIEHLAREAWVERTVVRCFSNEHEPERLDRLSLLRYH
jgi:hypothetical protein